VSPRPPRPFVHAHHVRLRRRQLRPHRRWVRRRASVRELQRLREVWRRRDTKRLRRRLLPGGDLCIPGHPVRSCGRRLRQRSQLRVVPGEPDVRRWREHRSLRLDRRRPHLHAAQLPGAAHLLRSGRRRLRQRAQLRKLPEGRRVRCGRQARRVRARLSAQDVPGARLHVRSERRWVRRRASVRNLQGPSHMRRRRQGQSVRWRHREVRTGKKGARAGGLSLHPLLPMFPIYVIL
jgi:hypothetical protein